MSTDELASRGQADPNTSSTTRGSTSPRCTEPNSATQSTARACASGTSGRPAARWATVGSSSETSAQVRSPRWARRAHRRAGRRSPPPACGPLSTTTSTRATSAPPANAATSSVCGRSAGWAAGAGAGQHAVLDASRSAPAVSSHAVLHAASERPARPLHGPEELGELPVAEPVRPTGARRPREEGLVADVRDELAQHRGALGVGDAVEVAQRRVRVGCRRPRDRVGAGARSAAYPHILRATPNSTHASVNSVTVVSPGRPCTRRTTR